jgi:tetratricopeptide (TPR) repeat protein
MAPEQFNRAACSDARSDVYSLGIMLYEMAGTNLPFLGPRWEDFMRQHLSERPVPLHKAPPGLWSVIKRCLRKEPASRYETFRDVLKDLKPVYEDCVGETFSEYMQDPAFLRLHAAGMATLEHYSRTGDLPEGSQFSALAKFTDAVAKSIVEQTKGVPRDELLRRAEKAQAAMAKVFEEKLGRKMPVFPIASETPEDLTVKAASLLNLRKPQEALDCCRRALAIDPKLHIAWNNAGTALMDMERIDEAFQCYERAIQVKPNYAKAWSGKASCFGRRGNYQSELACYEEALKHDPELLPALIGKATALDDTGRFVEALACYARAISLSPTDPAVWYNKGNTLSHLGRHREAIEAYREVLRLHPGFIPALGNLASTLVHLGDLDAAMRCYDEGFSRAPTDTKLLLGKAFVLYSLRHKEEALELANRAERLGDPNARNIIAAYFQKR